MSEPVRKYLYSLLAAIVAILVGYDLLNPDQATLWIGLVVALLGVPAVEKARSKVTPVE